MAPVPSARSYATRPSKTGCRIAAHRRARPRTMAEHLETLAKRRASNPEPSGDHPFDRFARRYASGLSRRHALKMALAGGLWLSAARQGIVAPPAHGRTLGRRRLRRCV